MRFILHPSSFILLLFLPLCVAAQEVIRLPAVAPEEAGPPGRLVSHPNSSSEILQAPGEGEIAPPDEPPLPPGVRNGMFQRLLFDAVWLAPGGANGMGVNDHELKGIFALPCPTIRSPLVITPGFGVQYLQGPENADLPPRLYDGYVDFRWMSQVTEQLGLDIGITPGIFSDFEQDSDKAMRYPGHVAAAWTSSETTKWVLGAAYLARPDIEMIPIGGVVWTPNEDWQLDLVFPQPRISRRSYWGGNDGEDVQDWVYLAAEFTGDAWAIRRSDGSDDQVVLSDYRIVLGMERKVLGGISSRFEIGYVFCRRIRYSSDTPDFEPDDTVMLRGGLTY